MPPLLSRAAAESLLADNIQLIGDCLRAGADRFAERRSTLGPISARSQASLIHDYAAEHAEIVFANDPSVTPRRCQELMVLDFFGEVFVRFRKFADGYSFSRNDTEQTRLWEDQLPLEGMPPATNLVAGYRLDEFGRDIEFVALVCTKRQRYMWHIEIPARGDVVVLPATLDDDVAVRPAVRSTMTVPEEGTGGRA
jgi:hypothetical protein